MTPQPRRPEQNHESVDLADTYKSFFSTQISYICSGIATHKHSGSQPHLTDFFDFFTHPDSFLFAVHALIEHSSLLLDRPTVKAGVFPKHLLCPFQPLTAKATTTIKTTPPKTPTVMETGS